MSKLKHLTDADFNAALPKDVAAKYEIIGMGKRTSTAVNLPKFGTINFADLKIKQAEYFVRQKATFIKLREVAKSKESKS